MKKLDKKTTPAIPDKVIQDMTVEFKSLWEQYSSKSLKHYQYSKLCDDVYARWNVSKENFHTQVNKLISGIAE